MERRPPSIIALLGFGSAYFASALLGLSLSAANGEVAAVWPANALLLLAWIGFGPHLSVRLGVIAWVGCLVANYLSGSPLVVSGMFATINVLEPALLFWLLQQDKRQITFDRPRQVIRYAALAVGVSLCAAAVTTIPLGVAGAASWSNLLSWFGADATAYLVVTPIGFLVIQLSRGDPDARPEQGATEVIAHLTVAGLLALIVFAQSTLPLLFVCFAALIVATYRLGPFGAASSTLIVAVVAIGCTKAGIGPIAAIQSGEAGRLLFAEFYVTVLFATASPLAALIADRSKLLSSVQRSEARFRRVVDHSGEIIFETDLQGRYTFLNAAWERTTGLSASAGIGRSFLSFVFEDDRADILARLHRLQSGVVDEITCECRWTMGEQVRWLSCRARPLNDQTGAMIGACGTLEDITERRAAELREADATERALRNHEFLWMAGALAHVGHWRLNLEEQILEVSEEASQLLQIPAGSFPLPEHPEHHYLEEDWPAVRQALVEGRAGNPFEFEARMLSADNEVRYLVTKGIAEPDWDGGVSALFAVVQDVTAMRLAEKALATQEAHYRRLTQNATDIVLQLDVSGICRFISPSVTEISGFSPEEMIGRDLAIIIHPDDQSAVRAAFLQVLQGKIERITMSYRSPHKDGRWLWLESNLRAERDPISGKIVGLTGSCRDVGDRKALEFELVEAKERAENDAALMYKLATTDELTGLANRRHFLARFDQELARVARYERRLSLAIFDIDFFKRVNDVHGHDGGDEVLKTVARFAASAVRASDLVGRLGGEEFGVLLPDCDEMAAAEICERLREAVASSLIRLPTGKACTATISIGLATLADGERADQAIRRADQALYAAKHAGRDCLKLAA